MTSTMSAKTEPSRTFVKITVDCSLVIQIRQSPYSDSATARADASWIMD